MFIVGISFIDILQEFDFVKTLIKVVLVVLQPAQLCFLCLSLIFAGSARNRMQVTHGVDFDIVTARQRRHSEEHAALHCVVLLFCSLSLHKPGVVDSCSMHWHC